MTLITHLLCAWLASFFNAICPGANTTLTATQIAREFGRVLHAKSKFISTITRQYDDQFANQGANRSDSVKILLPAQFTVSTGSALAAQDFTESSVTLQQGTQKHIDVNFTSKELTLDLNQFSDRVLSPMASVLVANIEADALSMMKDVPLFIDSDATAPTVLGVLQMKQKLLEHLALETGEFTIQALPTHAVKLVDAVKGLFNPVGRTASALESGMVQDDYLGFNNWYQNTLLPASQATGTSAKVTGYTVNGAGQTGAAITIQTGANTFKKGDIVTFAGCNDIQPETKADLGYLKQFTVAADYAGGGGNLSVSPAIVAAAVGNQNVTASPTNGGNVVKVGAGASETYVQSFGYHKEAMAIAFADLLDVSQFGAWGARKRVENISIRVARQYDINNDKFPTRIDVFYGYKAIRPELAVRWHADG